MKMTIDRFNDTVSRFVWQAMIPDLDGWGMCVLGGLERLGALRVEGRKLDALRLVGIAVESDAQEGETPQTVIDLDRLKTFLYGAAEAGGGVIRADLGVKLSVPRTKIDSFFEFVKTGAVS